MVTWVREYGISEWGSTVGTLVYFLPYSLDTVAVRAQVTPMGGVLIVDPRTGDAMDRFTVRADDVVSWDNGTGEVA